MRTKPYAFLKVGRRWINMAMVTDIEDHGDKLVIFVTADMARLASLDDPSAIDVARRFTVSDPDEVKKIEQWLLINDED